MRPKRHEGGRLQLDLLQPPRTLPRWAELPPQVKERVLPLLVQLLRDHPAGGDERTSQREVVNER